ncbi:MAG: multicopper oxidase family protein [Bacteroidota bacterium]
MHNQTLFLKWARLLLGGTLLLLGTSVSAQGFKLRPRADVVDNPYPNGVPDKPNFYEVPAIYSQKGELTIDLYVRMDTVIVDNKKVYLRTYDYEGKREEDRGAWGPTLRIKHSDKLNIRVHNELPVGGDSSLLGFLDPSSAGFLNTGDWENSTDLDSLEQKLIRNTWGPRKVLEGNISFKRKACDPVPVTVLARATSWEITGKELCQCDIYPNKPCVKNEIIYHLHRMINRADTTVAIRVYRIEDEHPKDHNIPHAFNVTNMHTHGLHISPFQDDIFRQVPPGHSSLYSYDLKEHSPGTMWYHPHMHGTTALQVASGMSGALIIEEESDTLDPNLVAASQPEHEKVLVFNQIVYDTATLELEDFNSMMRMAYPDTLSSNKLSSDKLRSDTLHKFNTTINGVTVPLIAIQTGEVQRWRIIHSGYRSALGLYFDQDTLEVKQIAVDGIMFEEMQDLKSIHLAPGNRTDLLVKVKDNLPAGTKIPILSGEYRAPCEYFREDPDCSEPKIRRKDQQPEPIAYLLVMGKQTKAMRFPDSLPGPGRKHPDISKKTGAYKRKVVFDIQNLEAYEKRISNKALHTVNDREFDAEVIDHKPLLNTIEEWTVVSDKFDHPYHIHVNPFLVTEFAGRKVVPPMWKDVVMAKDTVISLGSKVRGTAKFKIHYQEYWGDFVLHCHLLHHEDQGMMQMVRIVRREEDADYNQTVEK